MPETQNNPLYEPERSAMDEEVYADPEKKYVPADTDKTKKAEAHEELSKLDKLDKINKAIDMASYLPSAAQEGIMNQLLDKAGIPKGYKCSAELREKVIDYSKVLEPILKQYESEEDEPKREVLLEDMIQKIELYADNLMQQFLADNTPEHVQKSFQQRRMERVKDVYKTELVGAQMNIARWLTGNDPEKALETARSYIRESYFGLGNTEGLDAKTTDIIDQLAKHLVVQVQSNVLPVLENKIHEFAERGFLSSFWHRAKNLGSFAKDWVSTPFSDAARDRMAKGMTPIAYMGAGSMMEQFAPIIRDLAHTSYNVSLSKGELMELMQSLAGTVAFDAALMVATWGAGNVVKGAQVAEAGGNVAAATLTGVSAGFSLGKVALGPEYTATNSLSFSDIEKHVHEQLLAKN